MRHAASGRLPALVLGVGLLVGACGAPVEDTTASGAGDSGPALPEPRLDTSTSAPLPPPGGGEAPVLAQPEAAWKAPFDDVPYPAGDNLVGIRFPADDEAELGIVGVAPSGQTRWTVWTNPSCVGYGVTEVGDRPGAVVLASDADNREGTIATKTSANVYDTADGSRLWGPASVPGPLQGPGLIFGRVANSVVGGESGQRVMLAADTGEPVEPPVDGAVARYEHHGAGLFGHDGELTALDTGSGDTLWRSSELELPSGWSGTDRVGLLEGTQGSDAGVVALRWSGDGGERTSLHDLRTGELLAALGDETEFRSVVDPDSGTLVVSGLDGYRVTRAFDLRTGESRWTDDGADGLLALTLAESGVGYGTRSGVPVAVDLRTGLTIDRGEGSAPVAASDAGVLITPAPRPGDAEPTDRTAGATPGYLAHHRR